MILRMSPLVLLSVAALAAAHPAHQSEALTSYRDTHQGTVRPLQSIESSVVPNMKRQGAAYIGAEYNARALQYRLKFMNDGAVIWIDVDGRSGVIIGQAGQ
jgi:hypothetical protein